MNALERKRDTAIAEINRILENAKDDINEIVENLSADSYDYGVEDGQE